MHIGKDSQFQVHFLWDFKRESEISVLTLNMSPQLWGFSFYKIKNIIGTY